MTVLYMFRVTSCSSSGGQILSIQHLVSSLANCNLLPNNPIIVAQKAQYKQIPLTTILRASDALGFVVNGICVCCDFWATSFRLLGSKLQFASDDTKCCINKI